MTRVSLRPPLTHSFSRSEKREAFLGTVATEYDFVAGVRVMPAKSIAVFGIYATTREAEGAIDALQAAGFRGTDISVLLPEKAGKREIQRGKRTSTRGATVSGAVLGGALGWLAGMGMIAIPGVGPLIAAGPILSALAGVGIGGTVAGITGALIGTGIPEHEARRYERHVKRGGILMSVQADDDDWAVKARSILHETGAEDISLIGLARDHRRSGGAARRTARQSK
jgi:hypothetical protein